MEILEHTVYMRRALLLAANGRGHVSPNPMVGAVIVAPDGRIIGEGWHRRYGSPHAEVNAIASVSPADEHLLPVATMYVTLEPCSHYGKTPPCAALLVEKKIGKVVVGAGDPNPKVAGRGLAMLRQAGIEVIEGVLAQESIALNKTFMTAHKQGRPFVTLKWAMSEDAYIAACSCKGFRFSTPLTSVLVHGRRACHDAIVVGAATVLSDKPRLDVRFVEGRNPVPVIFDRQKLVSEEIKTLFPAGRCVHITQNLPLHQLLSCLFKEEGFTSVLVEGGANVLSQFINSGLWDEAYVEVSPVRLGKDGAVKAPVMPLAPVSEECADGGNRLLVYHNG